MKRKKPYVEGGVGGLRLDALGEATLLSKLGEGGRSTVYAADWRGRRVALKLYKSIAVERHILKHEQELAAYEYTRNRAFFEAPGLAPYIAEPLGYLATPAISAVLQEELPGTLYYFYHRERGGDVAPGIKNHLRKIVELSHEAGLYDIDCHAMNVMIVDVDGEPTPKLFDFNLVPFCDHPPNPFVGLALRMGWLDVRSRDLRKLRNFDDFSRVEKKLLKFYDEDSPS